MLQLIRDHVQGFLIWVIIGVIILAFALVGVNSYISGDGKAYAVKVNDSKVLLSDFQSAVQQERAFRQQIFGDNISPELIKDDVLQRAALDRLVSGEVVAQAAAASDFAISDGQLANNIRQVQAFQTDGKFDTSMYARVLNLQGYSQDHFEDTMRKEMLSRQYMDGMVQTAFVTSAEIDQLIKLKKQQRQFSYMVMNAEDLVENLEVSAAEIDQYYNDNLDQFSSDEMVSVEYLELTPNSGDAQITVNEDSLKQMYQDQVIEFSNGEQRHASHILIKSEDESDVAMEAAENKANKLYKEIQGGADFADLAKSSSDDPGSARQGGDLGFFGRGMMVGAFEDQVFAMNEGEISKPVKSPYGYHIIKLIEIKQGDTKSFDEVREELVQQYRREKAEEQFFDRADLLTDLVFEHPETLDIAAQELNLSVKKSIAFSRNRGQGIASYDQVRQAAFSADVLESGNNSDILTVSENHVAVVRVNDHSPAAPRALADVREEIINRLRQQQASDELQQRGKDIITKLEAGEDATTLAQDNGAEWLNSGYINRDDGSVNRQVLNFVFQVSRPTGDTDTSYAGVSLPGGDYVIAAVSGVRDGDPAEVDEQERQAIVDDYRNTKGQLLATKIMTALKGRAHIVEYLDQLEN